MAKDNFEKSRAHSSIALKRLIEEKAKAKSRTMKKLLTEEIEAYYSLEENIVNCVKMLGSIQTALHNGISDKQALAHFLVKRAEEIKMTGAYDEAEQILPDIKDLLEILKLENNVQSQSSDLSDVCCELFVGAANRNHARWDEIIGKIAIIGGNVILGCIPCVSTITDIGFGIKDTIQVIKKHTQEVPNYKNTDGELLLIEKHIEIMITVSSFFNRIATEVSTFVTGVES